MHTRPTSKKSYHYAALWGLAMGIAIGTSLAITQRIASRHRMPNLKVWRRALIDRHGEVQGAILAARVQARYEALSWERTKTLGRGDDCCDFRWSRAEPGQGTSSLIQVK